MFGLQNILLGLKKLRKLFSNNLQNRDVILKKRISDNNINYKLGPILKELDPLSQNTRMTLWTDNDKISINFYLDESGKIHVNTNIQK